MGLSSANRERERNERFNGILTFGQRYRGDLPRLYRMSIKCNQEERVAFDEQRHGTRTGASGVSDAESVTSSGNDRECREGYRGSAGLTTLPIDQKNRRLRVTLIERVLRRMLPLGHEDHVIRVVDIVKGAMGFPNVRLLYDKRAEDAVGDVSAWKVPSTNDFRSFHSGLSRDLSDKITKLTTKNRVSVPWTVKKVHLERFISDI